MQRCMEMLQVDFDMAIYIKAIVVSTIISEINISNIMCIDMKE